MAKGRSSKKYLSHKVYITLPGTGKVRVKVPVKAKPLARNLTFARTMAHVREGLAGECATCANAIAAQAAGLGRLVQFTDSRAYLVDKFNSKGVPTECWVGHHDQGAFQREFDTHKKRLLRSDRAEGAVTIYKFQPRKSRAGEKKPSGPSGTPGGTRVKRDRGAAARAGRAGIIAA